MVLKTTEVLAYFKQCSVTLGVDCCYCCSVMLGVDCCYCYVTLGVDIETGKICCYKDSDSYACMDKCACDIIQ